MSRWGLVVAFLAVLCLPVSEMYFRCFDVPINTENRHYADFPVLGWGALRGFPAAFENYFNDNFGLRGALIRWNNRLRIRLFGTSPLPAVILGKDGWLFYRSEALRDGNSINDYQGVLPLTASDLESIRSHLEQNRAEFARSGIPYLVVIAPGKQTVYPEYLPDELVKLHPVSRLDQLMDYLARSPDLDVLDLRTVLAEGKLRCPVFYKTDTHWNDYGAYLGYVAIMERISGRLPRGACLPVACSGVTPRAAEGPGDLAKMLSLEEQMPETCDVALDLPPAPPVPRLGTLVLKHDSFGDKLYPLLRRHFEPIVGLAPFADYDYAAIRAQHPNLVLHVLTERYINMGLNNDFFYESRQH